MKRKTASSSEDDVSDVEVPEESDGRADSRRRGPAGKKARSVKQATADELNRLRETENLFSSNFFRLQIEEVLKEVAVSSKRAGRFDSWLRRFSDSVSALEDGPSGQLTDQSWLEDVTAPCIQIPFETRGHFQFRAPKKVTVVGSHTFSGGLGPKLDVDIKLEMPKEIFNKDDYLNDRYHRKRSLYLAYLAQKLTDSGLAENLKYKLLNESISKPVLTFNPVEKSGKNIRVTLHVCPEQKTFKLSRFAPDKNNVRESWRFQADDDINSSIPTPYYNNAISADLVYDENNILLSNVLRDSDNLKQAILLLKIWLRQRHIYSFSGYIMTMFVVYLVRSRRINNAMSSYQVLRNVWTALASSDWDKTGICLADSKTDKVTIQKFQEHFPVVFLDSTGFNNICSYLSIDVYNVVKYESKLAVQFLDNQNVNSFHHLFMTSVDFSMKYDHILRIEYSKKLENLVLDNTAENTKLDHGPDRYPFVQKYIMNLLRKGLGNRISLLTPKCLSGPEREWSIDVVLKKSNPLRRHLIIGLKLDSDNAFGLIDKGPPANMMEAEEFRKFWGAKSELRRFQDGSICEACVWETSPTQAARRLIAKRIVFYLLQEKFGMDKKLFYVADQFESLLHSKKFQPNNFEYGTGEEAGLKANLALDSLVKNLRSITDIPLEVNSAQGISPVFSYTDPIPPLAYAPPSTKGFIFSGKYRLIPNESTNIVKKKHDEFRCPTYVPVLKVILNLSFSGKWPEDLEALKRIKAAFYVQLAKALNDQSSLTCQPCEYYLDVVKDGFVFRLEIGHQKEIALLKKSVDKDGMVKYKDTEESLEAQCRLLHLPRLRVALNGLYHRHQSFGPACCLVKRWIRAHMLDDYHFPELCIDLVVAYVYLRPEPYEVPNQPQVAFWRALHLLAMSDWNTQMLLLNFNDSLEKEEIIQIETNFTSQRSSLPPLYFVTPFEETKVSVWSKHGPSFKILARTQIIAKEALNLIDNTIFKNLSNDVISIFEPAIEGYDVLIHIKKNLNPLSYSSIKNIKLDTSTRLVKAYEKLENEFIPIADFNPVKIYLENLRSSYNEFALFFHDTYGGDVIGVLWKPMSMDNKEFKTSLVNGRKITKKGGIIADLDAILDGFCILGEGLIENIENVTNKTV